MTTDRKIERSEIAAMMAQGMLAHPTRYKPTPDYQHMHWHDALSYEAWDIADALCRAGYNRSIPNEDYK